MVDASNATLFAVLRRDGLEAACIYKPRSGERPLWDFPDGTLAGREVAAHVVSEATGWAVVPPTVLREGPFGPGSCQLWVESTDEDGLVDVVPAGAVPEGWLAVLDATGPGGAPVTLVHRDDPRLRRVALLDAVINNADRKGGHLLPTPAGAVHGIDHGVCFNEDEKLRTVLWGWAGEPLAEEEVEVLERLDAGLAEDGPLRAGLTGLLARREVETTQRRVRRLLRRGGHPRPPQGWPAIPWPPF
ncbi:SCO1664 family protein [Vallicoccus soli]|uniref:SCO1664 family protein n=1 Tax=Vallicoccus soli TaxID=2339232 RepID=A0A3A3YXT5_9ACTN|nr:SCO1664 family protein [Vallicoccus soli]